jgi:hypothetical protein
MWMFWLLFTMLSVPISFLWYYSVGTECKKYTKRVFYIAKKKKVVRCIAGLKHNDSCRESFISLNILTLFSLYIYETILFVKDKGKCITNDKIHAHDTISSLDYNLCVHRLGIHNSRLTTAGCKFCNKPPAYIKQIKDNPLFKRKLKQLLINGCYYSIENFIKDDFTDTGCWSALMLIFFSSIRFILSCDILNNLICNFCLDVTVLFISSYFSCHIKEICISLNLMLYLYTVYLP